MIGQCDRTDLGARTDLTIDLGMIAGDILLDRAVGGAHNVHETFHQVVESAVWFLVKTIEHGITDDQAVQMPPVIVELLDQLIEKESILQKRG